MAGYVTAAFFAEELFDIMAAADLVISRAGANILAEIATLGRPSLLVPLPVSTSRGDQIRNAETFRRRGAAVVLPQETATPSALCAEVLSLFEDHSRLHEMGLRAGALSRPGSAAAIAELIGRRIA
jgi:UDP-N-acetylglucosamine--N-acetylmuramyl-(pentapeptide) pyrophosphoryl-undecaprenol N-acetylglucosamine transferase